MEWSNNLSCNNDMIDADHKRLIELINRLHDAMMARQGSKMIGDVLNELVDYTKTHFGREEALMASKVYPHFLPHKGEHDKFIEQVNALQKKLEGGAISISLETMDFLRDWLFNHIMKVDQQLGKWVAAQPA